MKLSGSATTALTRQQRQEFMGGRELETTTMQCSEQEAQNQTIVYQWLTGERGFSPDVIKTADVSAVRGSPKPSVAFEYKRNGETYAKKVRVCDGSKKMYWVKGDDGLSPNFWREDCLLNYLDEHPDRDWETRTFLA